MRKNYWQSLIHLEDIKFGSLNFLLCHAVTILGTLTKFISLYLKDRSSFLDNFLALPYLNKFFQNHVLFVPKQRNENLSLALWHHFPAKKKQNKMIVCHKTSYHSAKFEFHKFFCECAASSPLLARCVCNLYLLFNSFNLNLT